jgi:Prealbumin-like fold domain
VIVVKDAEPNSNQDFVFTNNFANGNPVTFSLDDDADGTLANSRNSEVLAGTYAISEGAVAGWSATSATCSDGSPIGAVNVAPGETVTCTFVNTLQSGHLIVQKTTLPAGDTTSFAINLAGNGIITGASTSTITDATDKSYEVTAGTYSVTETVPAGWTKTGDTCQNVVVAAGQTATCLITNTQNGNLIVDKVTNPAGNATSFSILVSGNGTIVGGGAGTVTDAQTRRTKLPQVHIR